MLQVSTGYSQLLLSGHSFASMFGSGAILIYGNDAARPLSANAPATGTLIATITNLGLPWTPVTGTAYGLQFSQIGRYITGSLSQTWQLTPNSSAGLLSADHWRLVSANETGLPSQALPRIDGDVGLIASPSGQELLFDSLVLTPGLAIPVNTFFYTIPAND